MSFYDRKEVRDVLAYLKLLANPADEISLLRIINTPHRGISQSTVKRLLDEAISKSQPIWSILPRAGELDKLSPSALEAVQKFHGLIERYHKQADSPGKARIGARHPLVDLVKELLQEISYKRELARQYPDAGDQESRWASIEELVNALGSYSQSSKSATLVGFLHEVALTGNEQDRDKESQLDRNAVALMTLHAAKGLEFTEVYMVGMEEGLLPHHRSVSDGGSALDEERRLCYVGVTRAKRRLTLTMALTRNKWGKPRPTVPSRFLFEITGQADNPNYLAIKRKMHLPHAVTTSKSGEITAKKTPVSIPSRSGIQRKSSSKKSGRGA
jgi:DNA helicase-2/ATP-dependent DNA helicase PcrA